MPRIRVTTGETPTLRQARQQRKQLDDLSVELARCWSDCWDDPLAVEVLRALALAQSMDNAHPAGEQGRCSRRQCRRWWLFPQKRCAIRGMLGFCRTADPASLWFHVLNGLPDSTIDFAAVQTWLADCHAAKSQAVPAASD